MKPLLDLIQFVLGIMLGIMLMMVGTVLAARYLIEQFTAPPPIPIFTEEQPQPPQPSPQAGATPAPTPTPQPTPKPTPTPTPTEPDGQPARVTWPEGLILRDSPSLSAGVLGGIEFNDRVIILEDSPDGNWQRVWIAQGVEGWVKAGNLENVVE